MSQTIALDVDAPFRAWHRGILERLEAKGFAVEVTVAPSKPAIGPSLILALEQRIYRGPAALWEPVAAPVLARTGGDLALRIVLGRGTAGSARTLEPLFDGARGEAALFGALLAGRAPSLAIRAADGRVRATGLPAIEDPHVLTRALDAVLSRLITLIVQAVTATEDGETPHIEPLRRRSLRTSALRYLASALAAKLNRRFGPAKGRPDHWRTAYRLTQDPGIVAARTWPNVSFTMLDDDGTRFYADPFPFERNGRRYLFVEEFPYRSKKGVIAVSELDDTGTSSPPRSVLEAPVHLSYPFLLEDRSEVYMMPEMSGAKRIQLFRADPFPDRWVPDHILVDGIVASDATIIRHAGLWWLFATLSDGSGSTWDQLGLFHAPALHGPWTAHPGNPVLIDAGAARPAGAMWHEDGQLMRVAQDCRARYGAGLAICRVDRLDETGFAQTVVARLTPPPAVADAVGTHTLNRCSDLEVFDLRVPHRRRAGR